MPQVSVFDEQKARAAIKECPKIVRDYFKLIIEHWDGEKALRQKAIGKLIQVSKQQSLSVKLLEELIQKWEHDKLVFHKERKYGDQFATNKHVADLKGVVEQLKKD